MPSSPDLIHRARGALLGFYDARRRALPWRMHPQPYRVWVAEVMLQQTRADTVIPYYRAWLERFPDLASLATAPLDDVLRLWEGLGYYARARNLHRAALMVRERLGGELPCSAAALRRLPGVGEYTVAAVASIAFGETVPVVDGNVRRVLARLFEEPAPTAAWLRERAAELLDPDRPGDFNQALMELGATVCLPRATACGECPLASECRARRRGTVARCPRPRHRGPLPEVDIGVAALLRTEDGSHPELLLVRRPAEGLLGGLWELPGERVHREAAQSTAARAARAAGARVTGEPRALPIVRQLYSHFRGVYRPFVWLIRLLRSPLERRSRVESVWVDRAGLDARALPVVQRKIAEAVYRMGMFRDTGATSLSGQR